MIAKSSIMAERRLKYDTFSEGKKSGIDFTINNKFYSLEKIQTLFEDKRRKLFTKNLFSDFLLTVNN